jgi:eukaryotic-like serine/threonine-protein kinase
VEALAIGEVHYALATAFQWFLAALILGTGRPTVVRAGFAFVLLINGLETFTFFSAMRGLPHLDVAHHLYKVDGFLTLTLPFLASQVPGPLGGAHRAPWALRLWIASLALWGLVSLGTRSDDAFLAHAGLLSHEGAMVLALAILATHTIPRAVALPAGPLRLQSLLLAAGLGAGLVYAGVFLGHQAITGIVAVPTRTNPWPPFTTGLFAAGGYFALAAMAQAAWGSRGRRADALGVLGVLALGATLRGVDLAADPRLFAGVTNEFVTQAVRPVLLAVALLQYDLVRIPVGLRAPAVRAAAAMGGLGLVVMVLLPFTPGGLAATAVQPGPVLLAIVLVMGLALAAPASLRVVFETASGGPSEEAKRRLERYRLALERSRLGTNGHGPDPAAMAEVEALRLSLGIGSREHDALLAVLDGNLVVSPAVLDGATPGTVVAGRYTVARELGRGGQGRALLAHDPAGGAVVLKEALRPWEHDAAARRERLRLEAATAGRVASPHLARVLGVVEEPWQTYLVREHVPGDDLEEVVRRRGPLPPAEAARLVAGVVEGLAALHAAGLVHGDVKPRNVIVRPDGAPVLIDQGAAPPVEAQAELTAPLAVGENLVSLRWAAPEQAGGGPPDARTDVFQAAGVAYFALTSKPPLDGATATVLLPQVAAPVPLRWPAGLPKPLRAALDKAREAAPGLRYQDASAMAAALRGLTAGTRAGSSRRR